MKRCIEICCNFEHMKQGIKFDKYIQGKVIESKQRLEQRLEQYRPVLQERKKCLYFDGYHYYQITLASLPVTRSIISDKYSEVSITFSAQNNFFLF